jgi:hypothetical protein
MRENGTGPVPLIVLGGSDPQPAELPESGHDRQPLSGFKGSVVRIEGRPIIELICERARESGMFSSVYVVGPARIYDRLPDHVRLIDSDGTFGQNIRAGFEGAGADHPGSPVGFITCDILPDTATLRRLMENYAELSPCDLWFPMVRIPEAESGLGASDWKPAYRIVPSEGEPPVGILPGHLVVADPAALRLRFLYRLLQIGYRTRNKPIRHRKAVMLRKLILELFYQDILHIIALRIPNLTWTMLRAALPVAEELRAGTLTKARLENAIRKMFVKYRHRRRYPERRIEFPHVDDLSLALDIDTVEEAQAIGGKIAGNQA